MSESLDDIFIDEFFEIVETKALRPADIALLVRVGILEFEEDEDEGCS